MKSFKDIFKATKTPEQLAKKHKVPLKQIQNALKKGTKIEHEHTRIRRVAAMIAAHHTDEDHRYYDKLAKMEKNLHENIGLRLALRYLVAKKARPMVQKNVDIDKRREKAKANKRVAAAVLGGALGSMAGAVTGTPAGVLAGGAAGAALGRRVVSEKFYKPNPNFRSGADGSPQEHDEVKYQGIEGKLNNKMNFRNALRTGKVKTIPAYHFRTKGYENTEAGSDRPARDFANLDQAKKRRVNSQVAKKKIEMPIVIGKHLLAGNTRATRLARDNKPTSVLSINEKKYDKDWWRKKSLKAAIKDNIAHGKAQKRFKKKMKEVNEVLNPDSGAGTYVKDFYKSKAPQFKGKSKAKRRQMAIAAYLEAKRK